MPEVLDFIRPANPPYSGTPAPRRALESVRITRECLRLSPAEWDALSETVQAKLRIVIREHLMRSYNDDDEDR